MKYDRALISLLMLLLGVKLVYAGSETTGHISPRGPISVLVFLDENGNRIFDKGDQGYEGIPITLTPPKAYSDKEGKTCFGLISAGKYSISVDLSEVPVDLLCPVNTVQEVNLSEGESVTLSFPLFKAASLEGRVFIDKDRNGLYDEWEQGLSNRFVLANERMMPSEKDGSYQFRNILPGRYKLTLSKETFPDNFELTTPSVIEIELKPGEQREGFDFGLAIKEKEIEFE